MSVLEPLTFVNGRAQSEISVLDRGLAYGDGLFETMRLERGQLPFLGHHLARLQEGCERLVIAGDMAEVRRQLEQALDSVPVSWSNRGIVKLTLTRGIGGRGYQPESEITPTLIITITPFPQNRYPSEGIDVFLCRHRLPENTALAGIKHLNRLDNVLAAMEWRDSSCREGLLFDTKGKLVEAGSRNVFLLKDGKLLTPPLHKAGVTGILRERIAEDYAAKLGWAVEEASLDRGDLYAAEEMFLSNSVFGIWPVRQLLAANGRAVVLPGCAMGSRFQALYEADIEARLEA